LKVDIAIVTYRRPRGLHRLLGSFQRLRFPGVAPQLRIVVVDNDAAESARPICQDALAWLDLPLDYRVEKQRGIPRARNAAVAAALGHADFLAFIDDDEVPSPEWLAELLRIANSRLADAVAGPCQAVFEEPVPRWIERSRLFERRRHTTGARIDYAFTGNVLVRTEALERMDSLFDERLALTGGSDGEFFRRFHAAGNEIVWADTAPVFEWVPRSRANARWILERAYRVGTTSTWIDRHRELAPTPATRLLAHGAWCVAKGTGLLPVRALAGRGSALDALRLAAFGVGRISGLAGLGFEEYRTVHGG
jgi:glycosyltransferase involved in cell wall biosynthesis